VEHTGIQEHSEYDCSIQDYWSIKDYRSIQNMTGAKRVTEA